MNIAQPIRTRHDLEKLKEYYKGKKPNSRNLLLIIIGLNTALRISDILALKWDMVYDFEGEKYKSYITITEKKTGKGAQIYINSSAKDALSNYYEELKSAGKSITPDDYIFSHTNKNLPISRVQAFRIIKRAADECSLSGVISCHSLRKTFGYHAWKQGAPLAVLVNIYNHSSYNITKRYLGIEQDDKDSIYKSIQL